VVAYALIKVFFRLKTGGYVGQELNVMERFIMLIRKNVMVQQDSLGGKLNFNMHEMTKWVEELAGSGNYISGDALQTYGSYVNRDSVITDDPFVAETEAVSGYVLIYAENINQAGAIAENCTEVLKGRVAIEVRPIIDFRHD
jgi:hypothetical protein